MVFSLLYSSKVLGVHCCSSANVSNPCLKPSVSICSHFILCLLAPAKNFESVRMRVFVMFTVYIKWLLERNKSFYFVY